MGRLLRQLFRNPAQEMDLGIFKLNLQRALTNQIKDGILTISKNFIGRVS